MPELGEGRAGGGAVPSHNRATPQERPEAPAPARRYSDVLQEQVFREIEELKQRMISNGKRAAEWQERALQLQAHLDERDAIISQQEAQISQKEAQIAVLEQWHERAEKLQAEVAERDEIMQLHATGDLEQMKEMLRRMQARQEAQVGRAVLPLFLPKQGFAATP